MFRGKSLAILVGASALLTGMASGDAAAQCAADITVSRFDPSILEPLNRVRELDQAQDQSRIRDPREIVDIRGSILRDRQPAAHKVGFILNRSTAALSRQLQAAVSRTRDSEGGRYAVEELEMNDLGTAAGNDFDILVFWNWSGALSPRRIVQLDRFVQGGGRAVFLGGGTDERPPGGEAMLAAFGIRHAGAIDPATLPPSLLHFYGHEDDDARGRDERLEGRRDIFATQPGWQSGFTQLSGPMQPRHSFAAAPEDCGYDVIIARALTDGQTRVGMMSRADEGDGALVVFSDWRFAAHRNRRINGRNITAQETLQSGLWAYPNCYLAVGAITGESGLQACDPGPGFNAQDIGLDPSALISRGELVMTGELTLPYGLRHLELRDPAHPLQGVVIFDPVHDPAALAQIAHTLSGPLTLESAADIDDETALRTISGELELCAVPVVGETICAAVTAAAPTGGASSDGPYINLVSNLVAPTVSTSFDRMPEAIETSGNVWVENETLFNPTDYLTNIRRNTATRQCDELPVNRDRIGLPDLVHSSTAGIAHIESLVNMPATTAALTALAPQAPLETYTVHLGAYSNPLGEFPHAGDRALTGRYESLAGTQGPGLGFAGIEIRGALGIVIVTAMPSDLQLVFNYFDPDSCLAQWISGSTAGFTFTPGPGDPLGVVAAALAADFGGRPAMMEGVVFGSVITDPNIALSTGANGDRRAYGQNIDGMVQGWLVIRP